MASVAGVTNSGLDQAGQTEQQIDAFNQSEATQDAWTTAINKAAMNRIAVANQTTQSVPTP